MKFKRSMLTMAIAAVGLAGSAYAQDYSLNPTFGSVSLSAGFTPDPHRVSLRSGGSLRASNVDSGCSGYIANAPDYRLDYDSGSLPLIISVDSNADTTLVINGPNGAWYCNDDGGESGLNPMVRLEKPMSGQYDIWVGTYGSESTEAATLHISELHSQ